MKSHTGSYFERAIQDMVDFGARWLELLELTPGQYVPPGLGLATDMGWVYGMYGWSCAACGNYTKVPFDPDRKCDICESFRAKDEKCECGADAVKSPTHSSWCPCYLELF